MTQPLAFLVGRKPPVPMSADLQRIMALPRRPKVEPGTATAEALINHVTAKYGRGQRQCRCAEIQQKRHMRPKPCLQRLNYVQAWSLHEISLVGGLTGQIAVGGGKTIIGLLTPLAMPGCQCAVMLVPSTLVTQLVNEYDLLAEHFQVPSLVIHAGASSPPARFVTGKPVLHVLPYSRFQRSDKTVFLEQMAPDTLIVDEAQNLANLISTRTSRFIRYFAEHPNTRLCAWSGTLTDDEIQDYCLDPSTRVLTSDLRWVPIGGVKPGDELIGFDENTKHRKLRRSQVQGVKRLTKPRVKIITNKGEVVCSTDHQWILAGRARTFEKQGYTQLGLGGKRNEWIRADEVQPGDLLHRYVEPWDDATSFEDGWLAGMFDGEGWVSNATLGIAQKKGPVLDRIHAALRARGIQYKDTFHEKTQVMRITTLGAKVPLRLLGALRPTRLIAKAHSLWEGREAAGSRGGHARVLAVEVIPDGEVVAVQTSTSTFIAEGLLSHNCHLAGLALKEGSPVPLDPEVADTWGEALNPDDWVAPAGALKLLCREDEDVQDGYHRRLVETLGFISTTGASISTPLEIQQRTPPALPADVDEHLKKLRATWIRPDGEELIDAMSVARCARELACGLYLKWQFVNGETEALIKRWLAARKAWRAELREKLLRREPYLDSPLLCANAAMRAWGMTGPVTDLDENGRIVTQAERKEIPHWKAETWPEWYEIRTHVKPITVPVRVNPFLAQDAADWGRQNRGIIWYKTVAFGQWVAELSGLPMHGGGPKAGERILKEDGSRSIIASISSHGTGRDGLQRLFSTQLVTQPPSSAVAFEQLFGRLSRIGQEAEIIYAFLYRHTPEVRACVDEALRRALYCQKTMGQAQMLRAGYQIAA